MRTRGRAAVAIVCAGLLLAAGCARDSAARARRSDGVAAAHRATKVLGEQVIREPIAVTPYERQAFLELAMQPAVAIGSRPAVLERWPSDPKVAFAGAPTPEDVRRLGEAAMRWSLITHRNVTVATTGAADITVHFVPRAQFAATLGIDRVDPTAVGLSRVSFARGRRGEIAGAVVVVASDDDQVTRNRTIAHELGHAMGLQHSTCPSSLMDGSSDHDRSVRWSPSALDIRMGQLLYDPRLRPGLVRADVAATLMPTGSEGVTCGPVDLELIRAADSGRHYFCARSTARVRPCTDDVSIEPNLPIRRPDAWTDGRSLRAGPNG